jgi:hypothetical protein
MSTKPNQSKNRDIFSLFRKAEVSSGLSLKNKDLICIHPFNEEGKSVEVTALKTSKVAMRHNCLSQQFVLTDASQGSKRKAWFITPLQPLSQQELSRNLAVSMSGQLTWQRTGTDRQIFEFTNVKQNGYRWKRKNGLTLTLDEQDGSITEKDNTSNENQLWSIKKCKDTYNNDKIAKIGVINPTSNTK